MTTQHTKVFQSLSGTDIHAVFNDVIFGEIQMLAYKIDRDKAPIYTMGSADPRSIARGKRYIQGSCVFITFDRDALLSTMNDSNGVMNRPWLNKGDVANINLNKKQADNGSFGGIAGGSSNFFANQQYNAGFSGFNEKQPALLGDQLLPFNITLVGESEYGLVSKMTIYGVELMTEQGGVSIDDLALESQMTFIAKGISKWENQDRTATQQSFLSQPLELRA